MGFFFFFLSPPSLPGRWKCDKLVCECVCPLCSGAGAGHRAAGRSFWRSGPAIFSRCQGRECQGHLSPPATRYLPFSLFFEPPLHCEVAPEPLDSAFEEISLSSSSSLLNRVAEHSPLFLLAPGLPQIASAGTLPFAKT